MGQIVVRSSRKLIQLHQVFEVGNLPVHPVFGQIHLFQDPLRLERCVVLEVLALALSEPEDFLCKVVPDILIREVEQDLFVINHEKLESCLLRQEPSTLDFYDVAQVDHFLVWLCVRQLPLKEEDCTLLLLVVLIVVFFHVVEEDKLIVGHQQHSLLVAKRVKNLARALDHLLSLGLLVQEVLLLQIGDVLPLEVPLLDVGKSLAEVLYIFPAFSDAHLDAVPLHTCV